MYLIDTNVWLELLLKQERSAEVEKFFQRVESCYLAITEFSLYSIGIILTGFKKDNVFGDFLSDVEDSGVAIVRLGISELKEIISIRQKYNLDFDDAYQYVASVKYNYTLISFDKDFDRTDKGRITPDKISAI
jgi:hypothetical protein